MNLRVTLVALLSLCCAQATLTASTSYSFGINQPFDLYNGTAGVWNDTVASGSAGTGESIVCINAIGNTADVCGNPGPDDSASISIPAAPGNQTIVPPNPSPGATSINYLIEDGDPTYGAPVWTDMTGLTPGDNYILTFDQASSEENGNAKEYHDNWLVYAIPYTPPASGVGPYICLATVCTTATNPDPGDLIYQSPVMDNVPISTTPADPASTPWEAETVTFTATSADEILEFVTQAIAVGGGAFEPPLLALAGVTTDQTTPEPGTWVLTMLGAGLVFAGSRLRRRRTSSAYKRVKHAHVSTKG
jgi:hypothetical protein